MELWEVSVPLRGCLFEIIDGDGYIVVDHKFPSPYGDVCLKFHGIPALHRAGERKVFPSPYGDVCLK